MTLVSLSSAEILAGMTAAQASRVTFAEYLKQETTSTIRHDFINGEVYAMAGGSIEHGALAANVIGELKAVLGGKPCRVFTSDVRVRVAATHASFYPDLSVVCGTLEVASDDPQGIANPLVLVEVLSEGTETYDRGAKAMHYRRLSSLREYVLVSQGEPLVEVQRLNERGNWELFFFGPGQRIELTSLGVSIAVNSIYANPLA